MKGSEIVLQSVVGVTAFGAVVAGGALFAFSAVVMPALRSVDARAAIASMEAFNVEAPRSALMLPLVGSALAACVAGIWSSVVRADGWAVTVLGCIGVLAAFAVTVIYHVPRNNAFASTDVADAAAWHRYRTGWSLWNHVRVGLYCASGAVLAVAAVLPATRSADGAL
ncbi:putative membrane protein [Rhodococcus sp. OK519]|uniref:anthrone oxygenase family protein n=1 Tax=Rhodococcus sp. OK519 TaxID=2135729 RepID=UPI000D33CD52|nr:putative membrane protein [Rhodococcus sp. OK519]